MNDEDNYKNIVVFFFARLVFGRHRVLLFGSNTREGIPGACFWSMLGRGFRDEEYQQRVNTGLELLARHCRLILSNIRFCVLQEVETTKIIQL